MLNNGALAAVALEGASLGFGGRTILRDVSFSLEPGQFVALLGPNGAGKTTLLRAILGLLPLLAGRIAVFDRPPRRGDARIGYVPQLRAGAPARLLGRDWLAVAASATGTRADLDWALAQVGGESLATRPVADLSGGQRQRLMLAQALLGRPRLLLLDEPLISLDLPSQRAVVELAARLSRSLPATVLFSAHELTALLGHVDQVLYLAAGRAAIGAIDEVVTTPVLSRLYGAPVEVVRAAGRVFVVAGDGQPNACGEH